MFMVVSWSGLSSCASAAAVIAAAAIHFDQLTVLLTFQFHDHGHCLFIVVSVVLFHVTATTMLV